MKEFNEKFDITKVVTPLTELIVVDPDTVQDSDKNYYSLSSDAAKRLASVTSMNNATFSRKLYQTDAECWRMLFNKKTSLKEVAELMAKNNAVLVDDSMLMLAEGDTHIEDVVRSINKFVEDDSLSTCYQLYDQNQLMIIATNAETHRGVLIQYYMSANWVVVSNCYFNKAEKHFFISPFTELDVRVDEDIEALMEKDTLISNSGAVIEMVLDKNRESMANTYMSVEEFCWYMKKLFKIKLTIDKFSIFDYAADHEELSGRATQLMSDLIDKFYIDDTDPMLVNAAWLKKSIQMTRISYQDFSNLLETLVIEDVIPVNVLQDFQSKVIKKDTHYNQLN